ncbi:hypothetical protein PFISCL1PPCAC_7265, partial [Pristionchus fissidentatus]
QCKVFSTKFRRLCREAGMGESSSQVNTTTPLTTSSSIDGSKVGYEPPEIYITLTLLGAILFLICVCLPPLCRRYFFLPMEVQLQYFQVMAADGKLESLDDEDDEYDRRETVSNMTRTISL